MIRSLRLITRVFLIGSVLLLTACGARRGLPTPIPTIPPEARPSLPPTFTPTGTEGPSPTPSVTPTATLPPSATPTPTQTPGPSLTPTLTLTPSFTPSATSEEPSPTPTTEEAEETPGPPVAVGCSGASGGQNLLNNPGFEGGQFMQDYFEVNVPEGWVAFWSDNPNVDWDPENSDGFQRPDMQVIEKGPQYDNPPRILQGNRAFYIASGNRVFDGGIYQQVPIRSAGALCFGGYAHAWSSQGDDPTQSTLNTEDDRRNVTLQLGIDPTGGTSPWADSVVWGAPAHLYDSYQPLPGVQTYADGLTVTVFVRGSTLWRFNHNDLFFDDLSLTRVN